MVVHLYGKSCDMRTILKIAKKYNLNVFEDAAQSHCAYFENEMTGNLSDAAGLVYPGKI